MTGKSVTYDEFFSAEELTSIRGRHPAADRLLQSAYDCGMFSDSESNDFVARLKNVESPLFWTALSECIAAHFFRVNRFAVATRPPGHDGKVLDFQIKRGEETIMVEVKAIGSKKHAGEVNKYHETGQLDDRPARMYDGYRIYDVYYDDVVEKFNRDAVNLLLFVPWLHIRPSLDRNQLTRWLLGSWGSIYPRSGGVIHRPTQNGVFLAQKDLFHHISAVASLEMIHSDEFAFYVVHNPNASNPVPTVALGRYPQCLPSPDGNMRWSDGHGIGV